MYHNIGVEIQSKPISMTCVTKIHCDEPGWSHQLCCSHENRPHQPLNKVVSVGRQIQWRVWTTGLTVRCLRLATPSSASCSVNGCSQWLCTVEAQASCEQRGSKHGPWTTCIEFLDGSFKNIESWGPPPELPEPNLWRWSLGICSCEKAP